MKCQFYIHRVWRSNQLGCAVKSRTVAGRRVGDATLCVITHKSHLVTAVLVNVICFSWPVCVKHPHGGKIHFCRKEGHFFFSPTYSYSVHICPSGPIKAGSDLQLRGVSSCCWPKNHTLTFCLVLSSRSNLFPLCYQLWTGVSKGLAAPTRCPYLDDKCPSLISITV